MEGMEGGEGGGGFVLTALVRVIEVLVVAVWKKTTAVWCGRESEQHGCTNRRMSVHLGTCAECRWSGAEPEMLVEEEEERESE